MNENDLASRVADLEARMARVEARVGVSRPRSPLADDPVLLASLRRQAEDPNRIGVVLAEVEQRHYSALPADFGPVAANVARGLIANAALEASFPPSAWAPVIDAERARLAAEETERLARRRAGH